MSLTTEFTGIDPKKVDARIDALRQEIKTQLSPIVEELQQIRALERATVSWYSDNTADTVHSAANDGQAVTKKSIEQRISATSIDDSDGSDFSARVEKLMEKRPGFSLGAIFKRQVRSQKVAFLDDLKEKGEALLADARKAVRQAQTSLEQTRDGLYTNFESAQVFYDDLTQAITVEDIDALLAAIQSETVQTIPAHQRRNLLLKPMNDHDTAMLAIAEMDYSGKTKEAEILGAIMISLENDFDALNLASHTAQSIEDEGTKERYQAYVSAFLGTWIPLSASTTYSLIHVNRATYAEGKLQLRDTKGYNPSIPMEADEAQAVLDALQAKGMFFATPDGQVFNINHTHRATYAEGKLQLRDTKGYNPSISMEADEAQAVLDALQAKGMFFATPDGQVFNINHTHRATYAEGKLQLRDTKGYNPSIPMEADEAQAVLDALQAKGMFFATPDGQVFNINHTHRATYAEGKLQLRDTKGYNPSISMEADEAQAVLDALQAKGMFFATPDGQVFNINHTHRATYAEGKLQLRDTKGYNPSIPMEADEAQAVLDALQAKGMFFATPDGQVFNINHTHRATYAEGKLQLRDTKGYNPSISMEADEAQAVLDALQAKGMFFATPDGQVFNINHTHRATYAEGKLQLRDTKGYNPSIPMEADEAQAVVKAIRHLGQRRGIMQGANRNQVISALATARDWETSYRDNHQNTSDIMDYLPLIIVGAIILFDDHVQPDMHDIDVIGDQATLDGVGMDNEFADASGLGDMDTALGNDFGVDSFEADFADVDTGMDGGFDNDFDTGGGMDMGGGIDASSDFGGFGLN